MLVVMRRAVGERIVNEALIKPSQEDRPELSAVAAKLAKLGAKEQLTTLRDRHASGAGKRFYTLFALAGN